MQQRFKASSSSVANFRQNKFVDSFNYIAGETNYTHTENIDS
jgi:hypothetical protein